MSQNLDVQMNAIIAFQRRQSEKSTAFVCPHPDCGVYAQHHWGHAVHLSTSNNPTVLSVRSIAKNTKLVAAACEACGKEVIFIDGGMVWPATSTAPSANLDMPADVMADFDEARLIHQNSPRGAAALLRLALQKLMPQIGATKSSINDAIAELVAKGEIPQRVQQALDAVRVIGNEAVHPGELDLRDDAATVQAIFGLLNFIVEKTITEPKEIDHIYGGLPSAKRDGIAQRDNNGST